MSSDSADAPLVELIGDTVVAEISSDFTLFGTLVTVTEHILVFHDVDLHCQAEANSSRDIYAIETRDIGIRQIAQSYSFHDITFSP